MIGLFVSAGSVLMHRTVCRQSTSVLPRAVDLPGSFARVPVLPTDPMEFVLSVCPFPSGTPCWVSEGRTVVVVSHGSVALASALGVHDDPLLSRIWLMRWSRGTRHVRPHENSVRPNDVRACVGSPGLGPAITCSARRHGGMLPG